MCMVSLFNMNVFWCRGNVSLTRNVHICKQKDILFLYFLEISAISFYVYIEIDQSDIVLTF